MKYVNVKLLTMMTSVIFMMTAGPAAFGQATTNTHAPDLFPASLNEAPNGVYQWASTNVAGNTGDGSEFLDIISESVFVFFSPSGAFSVNAGNYAACLASLPTNPGDMLWVLYHSTDAAKTTVTSVSAEHTDIGVNSPSTIFFDSRDASTVPGILPQNPNAVAGDGFASGDPATTRSAANGGTIGANITPLLANAGEFYYWQKIDALGNLIAGAGNTGSPGEYTAAMCAFVDLFDLTGTGTKGDLSSDDLQNNVFASFQIQQQVGGMSIPISSTSLLVAGAEANALWILPILGLAGTIIAIRKLEA